MKKIVIASDSFKGSVTSKEVAQAAEHAIYKTFPECEVIKIPVGDGGEGTLEALLSNKNGRIVECTVEGPLGKLIKGNYCHLEDEKKAVIEMASVNGLHLIPAEKRNPKLTTTFGLGQLIKNAICRDCRNILIGIGGSATCDAGTGMLQALGFRFLDKNGKELGRGGEILKYIRSIDSSHVLPELNNIKFSIACDVNNPFYGTKGAAQVFARQKGADDEMIKSLDKGLMNFAHLIREDFQIDLNTVPGSGAAGGLGGGLITFLNAKLISGIQMMLEAVSFDDLIKGAEMIITGEGKLDAQTRMGKAPSGILEAGIKQKIPVIAIGGHIEDVDELNKLGFLAVLPLLPFPTTIKQALEKEFTLNNIKRTINQQLRIIKEYGVRK